MSATASIVPQPAPTLVNTLTQQFVNVVMRPAVEALSATQCRRIRAAVERHVNAGRIDTARALVSDEVTLACVQRELSRHITDCFMCSAPDVQCWISAQMERREAALLMQVNA